MYTRNVFGSYYPESSLLHNLNSIVKIFCFVICLIILFMFDSIYAISFFLIFVIMLCFISKVPFIYYFNTFYSLRYIYLLLALFFFYFDYSLTSYAVVVFKIIIFFEYINLISFTTSPSETIYSISKFLNIFNFLYFDVNTLAYHMNNIIRYYPLYESVKYSVIASSMRRGVVYNRLSFINKIKLHMSTRRLTKIKSKQILEESKLKLYDIKKSRTNYRTNSVSFNDIFFLLFHLVILYAGLLEGGFI